MKTATIIEKISSAMNLLDTDSDILSAYKFVLQNKADKFPIGMSCGMDLAILMNELYEELNNETLKETSGLSMVKIKKLLEKEMNKYCKGDRFKFAETQQVKGKEMVVAIVGGWYGFAFNKNYDLQLTKAEDVIKNYQPQFVFEGLIPKTSAYHLEDVSIPKIKQSIAKFKIDKKVNGWKKEKCYVTIDNVCFDAEFLLNTLTIIGSESLMIGGAFQLGYIENDNGIAVISPINNKDGGKLIYGDVRI